MADTVDLTLFAHTELVGARRDPRVVRRSTSCSSPVTGETEWNRVGRWQGNTDIPLSERGRAQALAMAASLRGRAIAAVSTSDLRRASETAAIVARALGIAAPDLDARLRERGFGCFEGLTRAECAERHPDVWTRYLADWSATPPDGEPQHEVAARMVAALTDIARAPLSTVEATLVISPTAARSDLHRRQ